MNYFELFGLPVTLQVDQKGLAKKYFELQKQFHPDFYTQSSEEEQQEVLEQSAMINKGLKILQLPAQTMQYVLQQKGILNEDEKYQLPPAFLMEMMELNEKLVEQSPEEFRKELEELEAALYNEIQDIVATYNDDTVTQAQLAQLKDFYFKKKYLQRILDRLGD